MYGDTDTDSTENQAKASSHETSDPSDDNPKLVDPSERHPIPVERDDLTSVSSRFPRISRQFTLEEDAEKDTLNDKIQPILEYHDLLVLKKTGSASKSTELTILSAVSSYQTISLQARTALHETEGSFAYCIGAGNDLIVVRKSGTGSNFTEICISSSLSNYQVYSLQSISCLKDSDQSYAFVAASNNDIFVIKKAKTTSGNLELSILSANASFKIFSLQTTIIPLPAKGRYAFAVSPSHDLFIFQQSGSASGSTELHILSAASNYARISAHIRTALGVTDSTMEFSVNSIGDVVIVKKAKTASGKVELLVLSSSSSYKAVAREVVVDLPLANHRTSFCLGRSDELLAIKSSRTTSRKVELLKFAADGGQYQSPPVPIRSNCFQKTRAFTFATMPNKDLMVIKRLGCESRKTEIKILSAASDYKTYTLDTSSAFVETDDDHSFCLLTNGDLMAICQAGSSSGQVEVQVLSAESLYKSVTRTVVTAMTLPKPNSTQFLAADNGDIFAINFSSTTSKKVTISVLTAMGSYSNVTESFETELECSDDYTFAFRRSSRDLFVIQSANTASECVEVSLLSADASYKGSISRHVTSFPETDTTFEYLLI